MAEMIPCKLCGRLFESNGYIELCAVCKVKDDEIYMRLRDYLIQYPGTKIFEVSNLLDIPIFYIKRYLREEKLEIVEKINSFLTCEKCGSPIRSGILCTACAKEARSSSPVINSSSGDKYNQIAQQTAAKGFEKIKFMERNTNKPKRLSI